MSSRAWHRGLFLVAGVCMVTGWAPAAPPLVDAVFPAGARRGEEVAVELVGKVAPETLRFWASAPGISWTPPTSDDSSAGSLKVHPDTPLGGHWLRFYGDGGTALPQLFVVGEAPERAEVEPNDSHLQADGVTNLPLCVNGRLTKRGDVDAFAVRLKKGQRLRAEVTAYRLDSPIDPLLRVTDDAGHLVAWNHDTFHSLDPVLEFEAAEESTYHVMVSGFVYPPQARSYFGGSAETVYRLDLKLLEKEGVAGQGPTTSGGEAEEAGVLEQDVSKDGLLTAPVRVRGVIDRALAEDVFAFDAVKGETYLIGVHARDLDSPLVGRLAIRDEAGKELAQIDAATGSDLSMVWAAPSQGRFQIALRDLRRQGGLDYRYTLSLERALPFCEATVTSHAWELKAGGRLVIPVALARQHGHRRPVTITLHGLPPTLTAQAQTVTGQAKEAQLVIACSQDCETAFGDHVFHLEAADGLRTQRVRWGVKGATTDKGALLRNTLDSFVISVKEADSK